MAVTEAEAALVAKQLGSWAPGKVEAPADEIASPERAASGANWLTTTDENGKVTPGKLDNFGLDLAARAKKGIAGADTIEKGLLYGIARPFMPDQVDPNSIAGKLMLPFEPSAESQAVAKNPKTVGGKLAGGAAEGIANMAAFPMAGGIARNIIAGIGMGEGSDIGGATLRGLFRYFGGDKAAQIGEDTGNVLGGGFGAQANVTRMKAVGEVASQAGNAVKSFFPAIQSTRAKIQAGDERNMFTIFSDEFGSLRAQTRGLIQDFTNRSIANTIRKNLQASRMAEDFTTDAKTVGMDIAPWGLAERTMVPALTELVANAKPDSYAKAGEIASRASSMKEAIRSAYNRWVQGSKIPLNEQGITATARAFQGITQAKVDALAGEQSAMKEGFSKFTPAQEATQGAALHVERDRLRDEAFQRGAAKYEGANALAGDVPTIGLYDLRGDISATLHKFPTLVDPATAPPVIKRILGATSSDALHGLEGRGGPDIFNTIGRAAEEQPGTAIGRTLEKAASDSAGVRFDAMSEGGGKVTLKEANDLYKSLGEAEANARFSENYAAASNLKNLKERVRQQIISSETLAPDAKKAWENAVANWEGDYAQRFQAGIGKALGKERGGAYAGRETLLNEKVMDQVLTGETSMREAERTFGASPIFTQAVETGLTDRFRKQVLDAKFTNVDDFERRVADFNEKYGAALERAPALRDKIGVQSAKTVTLENEKQMELQRYKDVMGGPIDKVVGPIQAKQLFESALADPRKMGQLVAATGGKAAPDLVKEIFQQANPFKNGEYDPNAILNMLNAGRSKLDGPSSMEILFKAAFGESGAKQHMATLEALANFTKRQMVTDPIHLQPGALLSSSPLRETSGGSAATWLSEFKAMAQGRVGMTYLGTLGISRFANARIQASIEQAKHAALYDPTTATAILEMVANAPNEALSLSTAKKIFGDIRTSSGQTLVDRLIDRGYVKENIGRGALFGATKAMQNENDPNSKDNLTKARNAPNQ